ncbi:uncharacterized [Tachysurus ichikawai]
MAKSVAPTGTPTALWPQGQCKRKEVYGKKAFWMLAQAGSIHTSYIGIKQEINTSHRHDGTIETSGAICLDSSDSDQTELRRNAGRLFTGERRTGGEEELLSFHLIFLTHTYTHFSCLAVMFRFSSPFHGAGFRLSCRLPCHFVLTDM